MSPSKPGPRKVSLDVVVARLRAPGLILALTGLFHGVSIVLSALLPMVVALLFTTGSGGISRDVVVGYGAVLLIVVLINTIAGLALAVSGWGMVNARSMSATVGGAAVGLPLVLAGGGTAFFLVPGCGTFFLLGTSTAAMLAVLYAVVTLLDPEVGAAYRHQARRAAQDREAATRDAKASRPGRR